MSAWTNGVRAWSLKATTPEQKKAFSIAGRVLDGFNEAGIEDMGTAITDGYAVFWVQFDVRYAAQAFFILLREEFKKAGVTLGVRRLGTYKVAFSGKYSA